MESLYYKTGWTVGNDKQSPISNNWAIKHHSLHKSPQFGKNYSSISSFLRLSGQIGSKNVLDTGTICLGKLNYSTLGTHQRLSVMQPNNEEFKQWLVGFTDGDGSFSIYNQNGK